jgi:beta-galactosidase
MKTDSFFTSSTRIFQSCGLLVFLFVFSLISCNRYEPKLPLNIQFNDAWLFHLGDVENGEDPEIQPSDWRTLNLPHDWSIEGEYSTENGADWQTGFLPTGIGWYRKEFDFEPAWNGKHIAIHFEGVYLNSDVWVNGVHLGHRPNGYIGFEYEISPYLQKGKNIITVRVDHSKPLTGRWYTGSGIYRHVWLKIRDNIHIPTWGVHFTSDVKLNGPSDYKVEIEIQNGTGEDLKLDVEIQLTEPSGKIAAIQKGKFPTESERISSALLSGSIEQPALWSPDNPNLYSLKTILSREGVILDEYTLKVGFRKTEFTAADGFILNGQPTLFKGVCDHHTAGPVGAAIPDDVLRYRLTLLKEMGCNAIRTAHNPFSPTFYNLCDELGLMVMNEFLDGWEKEKAKHDYGLYFEDWWEKDGTDFIKRDRNHPSVIMWSIGNEVVRPTLETQKKLVDLFHSLDPTRPVTQGGKSPSRGDEISLHDQLDLAGYNGHGEERGVFESHHERYPDDVIIGTEIPHTYQTRGVYRTQTHWRVRDFPAMWEIGGKKAGKLGDLRDRIFPIDDLADEELFTHEICSTYYMNGTYYPIENDAPWAGTLYYQSSYDNATVRAGARKTWQRVVELPYVAGMFRWGSFDYLGETNNWPSRFCNFGVIDAGGIPKDHFYLYQSLWTEKPMVHLLPHWTHPGLEGKTIPVVAYTNCEEVEVFLNGQSMGKKPYEGEQLVWNIPYEPGTIKAVGYRKGQIEASMEYATAGEPYGVKLESEKAVLSENRREVTHILVSIVDSAGNLCPYADLPVDFEVKGPGKLIGTDNGDPLDLSSYKSNSRRTFRGQAMILVESSNKSGTIEITGRSAGLENGIALLEKRDSQ